MSIDNLESEYRILEILNQDRVWSAYALADLDPDHQPFCEWFVAEDALLLRYSGLNPPILFGHGSSDQLNALLPQLPPGKHQISFPEAYPHSMPAAITRYDLIAMWRMTHLKTKRMPSKFVEVLPLGEQHLGQIDQLYTNHPDAPDGYHPRQVALGPFTGVMESGMLVATAGVHVLSKRQGIAALGNIYTHPAYRQKGYASACTTSVIIALQDLGIETIVLNVSQENNGAVELYKALGFSLHCPFYEGLIEIPESFPVS